MLTNQSRVLRVLTDQSITCATELRLLLGSEARWRLRRLASSAHGSRSLHRLTASTRLRVAITRSWRSEVRRMSEVTRSLYYLEVGAYKDGSGQFRLGYHWVIATAGQARILLVT